MHPPAFFLSIAKGAECSSLSAATTKMPLVLFTYPLIGTLLNISRMAARTGSYQKASREASDQELRM
jgi:hypothetical protein